MSLAEFRGPGIHHQFDQDSPDDYDLDVHRYRGNGRNGRIILLGDGTEVLTDSTDDADMFDHSMEDDHDDKDPKDAATTDGDDQRNKREGTPGPQSIADMNEEVKKDHEKLNETSRGPDTAVKGVADKP